MKLLKIYNNILESSKTDISFNKESKRIYQKIVKNIDSIKFIPTPNDNESEFVKDSRGNVHTLEGVKFNLNQIDKKYDLDILLVHTLGRANHHYDHNANRMVFFILSQTSNKSDFNNNSNLARIRFKSWVNEDLFVHEFTHYLDANRYKDTYHFSNPENNKEYYNSPEEYNAFSHEIINQILKNKNSLMKLDFNVFLKKVLKYGSVDFIKSLSDNNKKKLKNRLYKIYSELNGKQVNLNENILNQIKFSQSKNEDYIKILAKLNNKEIGHISLENMTNAYWYFEGEFSEDEYYKLFPNDNFIKIEHLEINDNYKGQGIAKELIKKALNISKKLGYKQIYLNASPMGFSGLQLSDLVGFYESFGFKEILHQGNNVQMLLNI